MHKLIYPFLFYILLPNFITPQGLNIDSLKAELESLPDDTNKVNKLNGLAWELIYKERTFCSYLANHSLTLSQKIGFDKGEGKAYNIIGGIDYLSGNYSEAMESYQNAGNLFERIGDSLGVSKAIGNMALVLEGMGYFKEAIEKHKQSFSIAEKLNNLSEMSISLNNIGIAYKEIGENGLAEKYYLESLAIERKLGNAGGIAPALVNLGNVYKDRGEYDKAIQFYNEGKENYLSLPDSSGVARALNNIGIAYMKKGDLDSSIAYYTQSLKIKEEHQDKKGVGNSLINVGLSLSHFGQDIKAINYYQKAHKTFTEIPYLNGQYSAFYNIGSAYSKLMMLDSALHFHSKCLDIARSLKSRQMVGASLMNVGSVLCQKEDYANGIQYLTEALDSLKGSHNQSDIAQCYQLLGQSYLIEGNYLKAKSMLSQGEEIAERTGDSFVKKDLYGSLADYYKKINDFPKANKYLGLYITVNDSLLSQSHAEAVAMAEARYKNEKIKRELADQKLITQQRDYEIAYQKLRSKILILVLLLTLVLAAFLTWKWKTDKQRAEEREQHLLDINSDLVGENMKLVNEKEQLSKSLLFYNTDILRLTNREKNAIPLKNIIYLEMIANKKKILVHTTTSIYEDSQSLSAFEKILPNNFFVRIHRSHIVNLHFVAATSSDFVTLKSEDESKTTSGKRLSIGKKHLRQLEKACDHFFLTPDV